MRLPWLNFVSMATLLALSLLLHGCSGLKGRAEKYYEAEAYEEAEATYQEMLAEDPRDADAIIGLNKTRLKIVDKKLIQVRLSRMGGNQQNSLDMLLSIVHRENEGGFYPKDRVAWTQEEETKEALKYVTRIARNGNQRGRPLQSLIFLQKYEPIFKGPQLKAFQAIKSETFQAGLRVCGIFRKMAGPQYPYFSQFVTTFCSNWGSSDRQVASLNESANKELFGKISSTIRIANLPYQLVPVFLEAIEQNFKSTPWYAADGKNQMKVQLQGGFISKNNSRPEIRQHSYTIEVPYTAYQPVRKSRQVPYETTEYVCAYSGGKSACANMPKTAYRTDYYTENEPVTLYRDVPQVKNYDVSVFYQFLFLNGNGVVRLGNDQLPISIAKKAEISDYEHSWNLPDIGLFPRASRMADPLVWLKARAAEVGEVLSYKANQLWASRYCSPKAGNSSIASSGDQVFRCLRLESEEPPAFVDKWYMNHLGVSKLDADIVLYKAK
jgi:hypothetical protein